MRLVFLAIGAVALIWVVDVALNPWALHIGGHSTPLLYWHGSGTLVAKGGKTYLLYVSFYPGRPGRGGGGRRREGRNWHADLRGSGALCIAPGKIETMKLSGTMYGGNTNTDGSLMDFRFIEWQSSFQFGPRTRGFFDVTGAWHGEDLVMDRLNGQGGPFQSGVRIDSATVTLHWSNYEAFESACRSMVARQGGR